MTEVLFDLYEILVENIFGSVGLAIMGVALLLIVILFFLRTSAIFIVYWMMFYFIVMATLYIGALGLMLGGFVVISYTLIAIIRIIFRSD